MARFRICRYCDRRAGVSGLCLVHAPLVATAPRAADRLWHSRRARKFRAAFLADNPYCADCHARGKTVAATVVHHLVPQLKRPDLVLDERNLLPLCDGCHARRHA